MVTDKELNQQKKKWEIQKLRGEAIGIYLRDIAIAVGLLSLCFSGFDAVRKIVIKGDSVEIVTVGSRMASGGAGVRRGTASVSPRDMRVTRTARSAGTSAAAAVATVEYKAVKTVEKSLVSWYNPIFWGTSFLALLVFIRKKKKGAEGI